MRTADLWRRLRIVGAVECRNSPLDGLLVHPIANPDNAPPRDIFQDFGLPKMHTIRHHIGPRTGILPFYPF